MSGLYFLPLGGTGEIGMNLNLYGFKNRWLMVDLGITFADDSLPGADILMPDIDFIKGQKENLVGLVLTHAHEDHIGAVPYLWSELKCPIYATSFTVSMVKKKFEEAGIHDAVIHTVPLKGKVSLDPFEVEFVTLTHSIPEPNALLIKTEQGNIFHTGDWKFDHDPLIGETTDINTLKKIGDEGVLALVGDSTNALCDGTSGSESKVRENLSSVIEKCSGRVFISCFASNVARLETLITVAQSLNKKVFLVGHSLKKIVEIAKDNGLLSKILPLFDDAEIDNFPKNEVVVICTGSQGENRAALNRIANDDHPYITIAQDDTVIFSSRIIPGNEIRINHIQNKLIKKGAHIVEHDDDISYVHVSGHPARDELIEMYQYIRPQIAIPVHGEYRHLQAHADLAKQCQVPQTIIAENGAKILLDKKQSEIQDTVECGRLALDGHRLIKMDSPILSMRKRLAWNGSIHVIIKKHGKDFRRNSVEKISAPGLLDPQLDQNVMIAIEESMNDCFLNIDKTQSKNDQYVEDVLRQTLRKTLTSFGFDLKNKRPLIEITIV